MALYPKKKEKRSTTKQKRFVQYYEGDPVAAAKAAGYEAPHKAASVHMKNPVMISAIREREKANPDPRIMNRQERQILLTAIARDQKMGMPNRLKSIEMLCKMNGDFLIRHEVTESKEDVFRQEIRAAAIGFFNQTTQKERQTY